MADLSGIPRTPDQYSTRTKRAIARLADQLMLLKALSSTGVTGGGASIGLINTDTPVGNTITNTNVATAFATQWVIPASTLVLGSRIRCDFWGAFYTGSHT